MDERREPPAIVGPREGARIGSSTDEEIAPCTGDDGTALVEPKSTQAIDRSTERKPRIPREARATEHVRIFGERFREAPIVFENRVEHDEEVLADAERAPRKVGAVAAPCDRSHALEERRIGARSIGAVSG